MVSYIHDRADFMAGRTTVQERVDFFLSSIDDQSALNAWLFVDRDQARAAAMAADERFAAGLARPLEGCVVAVKDNISVKGMPMTCASRMLDGFTPVYHATVIERLLDAGAIILGKTNMDEFAMGSSNETSAFGAVLNPHDPSRVPGGSSGGSAVAVAASMCHVALGSDTGGSIRQPAAFCGTVGLKPTYGTVSRYGLTAFASSLDQIGPFASTVDDAALVFDVMAGQDPLDSTSLTREQPSVATRPPSSIRVGVIPPATMEGCDRAIIHAYHNAIDTLRANGTSIHEVSLGNTDVWVPTYFVLATAEASSNLSRFDGVRYGFRAEPTEDLDMMTATRTAGFGAEVKRRIMLGTFVLSAGYVDAYYGKAQKARRLISDTYAAMFADVDVLLMPTTPTTAFRLGEKNSDPVAMWLSDLFTVSANISGIPAVSVPTGKDDHGLPIGLQVQGPLHADALVMAVASLITS